MAEDMSFDDSSEHRGHIPFAAQIAGVKDERTFFSDAVGANGRRSLVKRGRYKLIVPGGLAIAVSYIGYVVMGVAGLAFGPLFFVANAWIQSIANPIISVNKVLHQSPVAPVVGAFTLLLISGTFAATLTSWFLFKATIDQRHLTDVAKTMVTSQEKQNVTFAESALERERAALLTKQQVNTSGIEQATKALAQAQETAASANAAFQLEVSKGGAGRKAGDGPAAKALRQAVLDASSAEVRAKQSLDEARVQASSSIPIPEGLVAAYNLNKGTYEAKERALFEVGPGMLKTFWWLISILHTEPMLIVFLLVWTTLEASGVISHAFAGRNVYERERLASIKDDAEVQKEARQILQERITARAEHTAAMRVAKNEAKVVILDARDKSKN
jgi:hypothetical protein